MASNHQDVLDQLRAFGLIVEDLRVGEARPVRCKVEGGDREKRGWYILHELHTTDGDVLLVGSFGMWRGNENHSQKIAIRKDAFSAEQREALKRRWNEDRKRAERQRAEEAARAAARAAAAWARLEHTGDSPYLAKKGVQGHGLRYTTSGSAVLPLLDGGGKIHGLQFLRTPAQAEKTRRPAKEFWPPGLVKKGHFHLLGAPQHLILIAEGYADAATLHEATGYPVAVAFDAGNIEHVAIALRKRYKRARILICADDDVLAKCGQQDCRQRFILADHPKDCPHCDREHRATNAGITGASTAALAVDGAWLAPRFADEALRRSQFLATGAKVTDFNDLHAMEGLHVVRTQIEARLSDLGWRPPAPRASSSSTGGGERDKLKPIQHLDDLLQRFALVYAAGGAVFDRAEHCLLPLTDMRNVCVRSELHKAWMEHPDRDIVRQVEVGFDPACTDPAITCNLWGGWPTKPRQGSCDRLLELLRYMCSGETRHASRVYDWVLKWIAYPIQHPGAKMKSTIVVHGPQGTGKNVFFEAVMAIYGQYGRILDQDALVDKHNDWASRKLFLIADEVVAQAHRYELKNKLKTLITGNQIRINPKHIAAYDEANHCNLVFLSNEAMPAVLEEDDRRHCVIWTPPKLGKDVYAALLAEIANGGVGALHDYLLRLPLGDFDEGCQPPDTDAKFELISLGQDSPLEFVDALVTGDVPHMAMIPGLTTDWYRAYVRWCGTVGVKPAPLKRFQNVIGRKRGFDATRKRYLRGQTTLGPHSVLMFGCTPPEGGDDTMWLGDQIDAMRSALHDLLGGAS